LDLSSNTSILILHHAVTLTSQVTEVLLYCNCKHTSTCQTRCCNCFESGRKCTTYCHRHTHHIDDQAGSCLNLAVPAECNTRTLIPRRPISVISLSPPSHSLLALLSAPTHLHSPSPGSPISESPIVQFPEVLSVPSVPGPTPPIIYKRRSLLLSSSISESASASSAVPATLAPDPKNALPTRLLRKRV